MKEQIRWWLYRVICFALNVDVIGNVASDSIEHVDTLLFTERK